MKVLTIQASAASTVSYVFPVDTRVFALMSTANGTYVTLNPTAVITDFTAPAASGFRSDLLWPSVSSGSGSMVWMPADGVFIAAGAKVYFIFQAAGSLSIFWN